MLSEQQLVGKSMPEPAELPCFQCVHDASIITLMLPEQPALSTSMPHDAACYPCHKRLQELRCCEHMLPEQPLARRSMSHAALHQCAQCARVGIYARNQSGIRAAGASIHHAVHVAIIKLSSMYQNNHWLPTPYPG